MYWYIVLDTIATIFLIFFHCTLILRCLRLDSELRRCLIGICLLNPSTYNTPLQSDFSLQFRSWLRSLTNREPCNGLVSMSANMSLVGQYCSWISLASTRSLIKKNRTATCLVRSEAGLPSSMSLRVLMLSWNMVAGGTMNPSSSRRFRIAIILDTKSEQAISSDSVDDLDTSFCLDDLQRIAPCPIDIVAPVWPLASGWTAWDASTYA